MSEAVCRNAVYNELLKGRNDIMMCTVKPIMFRGKMTINKLKRYAKDPNVFVIYNVYSSVKRICEHISNLNYPEYDACYKTRPLDYLYKQATDNLAESRALENLCLNINTGKYVIFRIIPLSV